MSPNISEAVFRGGTFCALLTALVLAGCSRSVTHRQFVARVDNAELSSDEIASARDSLRATAGQSQEYVNEWIVNELLYQEAMRRGMAETPGIRRDLEAARKHLMIAALLEREVYGPDSAGADEAAVDSFYRVSGSALALREDIVNASYALFSERDAANAFRSRVLRGTPWPDAVLQCQRDSAMRPLLLQTAARQYFSQSTLFPEELWKLARTLGKEEVSFVLKTNAGYYVLQSHGLKRQGEIPDLDYVRGEIRDRLQIEQRRTRYDRLIADLRTRHSVELRTDIADTAAAE